MYFVVIFFDFSSRFLSFVFFIFLFQLILFQSFFHLFKITPRAFASVGELNGFVAFSGEHQNIARLCDIGCEFYSQCPFWDNEKIFS
jgi:hypothetical protein